MSAYNTERKLDILTKLAGGTITPQEADRLLKRLEEGVENGDIEEIRQRIYEILDIPDADDNNYDDEDGDEDEEQWYSEQRDLADNVTYDTVIDICRELIEGYDMDADRFLDEVVPLLPDSDDTFAELLDMADSLTGCCNDEEIIHAIRDNFEMSGHRVQEFLLKAAELSDSAFIEAVRTLEHSIETTRTVLKVFESGENDASAECLARMVADDLLVFDDQLVDDYIEMLGTMMGTGAFRGNTSNLVSMLIGKKSGRKTNTAGAACADSWHNVWRDCFSKDSDAALRGNNGRINISPFPSYESVSIELPEINFRSQSESPEGKVEGKLSARNVTIGSPCELEAVDARRLHAEAETVINGEARCASIDSRVSLLLRGRACFDRLSTDGELEACDLLVGNSADIRGQSRLSDIQARVISLNGGNELGGAVKAVSVTASGKTEFRDTVRSAEISVSGDTDFSADVHCARFNSMGSLRAQREVWVRDLLRCEGTAEFEGRLSCRRLSASGKLLLRQGVSCNRGAFEMNGSCISMAKIDEVFSVGINGQITATDIGALLNWTKAVDITMRDGDSSVQTITAVTTRVDALDSSRLKAGSISGYSIDIKNTDADNIRANYVAVGKGCHIKLLQYVNAVQVHPEAIVERTEKISPN